MSAVEQRSYDELVKNVLAANRRFYGAIEQRDFDAMAAVWEQSKRAICVHPGWPIRRGWEAVANSWITLLDGPGRNQIILSNASVSIESDLAWVVLDEDVVDNESSVSMATTNIFARHGDDWLMIVHHGSPIVPQYIVDDYELG